MRSSHSAQRSRDDRPSAADTGAGEQAVLDAIESLTVTYCQTWQYDDAPARLAAEMQARHGLAMTVLNKGIGGEVTTDMLRRFKEDVLAHRPSLVIWQTGTADAIHTSDVVSTVHRVESSLLQARIERLTSFAFDTYVELREQVFRLRQQVAGYIAVISYLESKLGIDENGTPV